MNTKLKGFIDDQISMIVSDASLIVALKDCCTQRQDIINTLIKESIEKDKKIAELESEIAIFKTLSKEEY
jgi:hypothetical protein